MDIALLCIGRNVADAPMDGLRWLTFKGELCALIARHGGQLINRADGIGYWQGEAEDTFIATFSGADLTALEAELPLLALMFGQEAIGLITGTSTLAYA